MALRSLGSPQSELSNGLRYSRKLVGIRPRAFNCHSELEPLMIRKSRRTARQIGQWSVAGGALVAGALVGLFAAAPARAEVVDTTDATPAELLNMGSDAVTQANQLLSQADLSNVSNASDVGSFIANQTSLQDAMLQWNHSALTQQAEILSNASAFGSQLDTWLFSYADQPVYQADEAVLQADQAFDAALANLTSESVVLPVSVTDFQVLGAYLPLDFIDAVAAMIQGI